VVRYLIFGDLLCPILGPAALDNNNQSVHGHSMALRDFFRVRRKSVQLIPNIEHPVAFDAGVHNPSSAGVLLNDPTSIPTSGAVKEQRTRSQSVYNQPTAGLQIRPVTEQRSHIKSPANTSRSRQFPNAQLGNWHKVNSV